MSSIAAAPHNRRISKSTDSWITPKWLLDRLGPFDLDPCASTPQPWATAERMINERENGLLCLWFGLVWLNPPYSRKEVGYWLERMALHNNGMVLLFARTDTKAFHDHVWPVASALLFLRGRLDFHQPNGAATPGGHNSGGPSVLIAYGAESARRLAACQDLGALVIPSRNQAPLSS